MKKQIRMIFSCLIMVIFLTVVLISFTKPVFSLTKTVEGSAFLVENQNTKAKDYRSQTLKKFFQKFDSPLTPFAEEFVFYADQNGIDWRLLPAISGVESSFGKYIPVNSFNAYGWNNGNFYFQSWEEGIEVVSTALKKNYYDRGANTVTKIGGIYAVSNAWPYKVNHYIEAIDHLSQLMPLKDF